jgi:5'-3' exonuclease
MKTVAAIDGDILCYECGFASDAAAKANGMSREPLGFCLAGVRKKIDAILRNTEAEDYVVFLTGKPASGGLPYREIIFPEYKKNRDETHKPQWYKEIKNYLITRHPSFVCTDGLEADDWLGIYSTKHSTKDSPVVIASKDKDLDMIAGLHYNWSKSKEHLGVYDVSPIDGLRWFYKQMLTGDATDNIPGIYKLFKRKATKKVLDRLEELDTLDELTDYVLEQYDNQLDVFLKNGELLWIRRDPHEGFTEWYNDLRR